MTTKQKWLRVEMAADNPNIADMFIFGFIGDWVDALWEDIGFGFDSVKTAKGFQQELDALPDSVKAIHLHVNSPGGDVFGAVTIANMLREQVQSKGRTVETTVEGLAASAASIVIQAGNPVRIADNGLVMIHLPWTRVQGNAKEIRDVADELDTITRGSIIPTYQWHSDLDEDAILAMLEATTWLSADEAIENGFATEKIEGLQAAACIHPSSLSALNVPGKYLDRVKSLVEQPEPTGPTEPAEPPTAASATEVLALCRENDCLDVAEELVTAGASLKDVRARVAAEKETRQKAETRATEIRGLCEKAKLEELADGYISGQMPIDSVRAQLTTLTAKMDGPEIDGGIDPNHGQPDAATSWKKAFSRANNRFGARRRDTK